MARANVDNLGGVGVVRDIFAADCPPEAWTAVRNTRMGQLGAEVFLGHEKTLGTGAAGWTQQPLFLFYAPLAGGVGCWLGCGTTKIYCRESKGSFTETDVTRAAGAYAATQDKKWQGDMFGGLAVLNNGVDEPQIWPAVAGGVQMVNLSTVGASPWPANNRCKVIRPFGRFLVAIDITKAGVRDPQRVKWSHPADPGLYPSSWDFTNPAVDAGEYPLSDAEGPLVDMRTLRDVNYIYSTDSVWQMKYVQGGDIFGFTPIFGEQGALATNCVAQFKKSTEWHIVLGGDDIYIHNGQTPQTIISPAMRRWIFQQIDPTNYARSFVVANPVYNEAWICFPQIGAEQPTLALVWNWETNSIGFRDLLQTTSGTDTRTTTGTQGTPSIALGMLEDAGAETWDTDTALADDNNIIWDARSTSPVLRRLLMADRSAGNRAFLLDNNYTFDGETIPWSAERQSIATRQTRDGKMCVDTESEKLVTEFWARMEITAGTTVNVQLGTQESPEAPVQWGDILAWVAGATDFLPEYISGRILSVRMSGDFSSRVRITGYSLEGTGIGKY